MPGNRTAVRKENRAGAVPAPQAFFFTEMREETADRCVAPRLAGRPFVLDPVDAAISRAGPAVGERGQSAFRSLAKLGIAHFQICRREGLHRDHRSGRKNLPRITRNLAESYARMLARASSSVVWSSSTVSSRVIFISVRTFAERLQS